MHQDQPADTPRGKGGEIDTYSARRLAGEGRRSASPAKRSAAVMEGREDTQLPQADQVASPQDAAMSGYTSIQATDDAKLDGSHDSGTDAEVDERLGQVMGLLYTDISKNEAGYVVSYRWLARVFARSSHELPSKRAVTAEDAHGPIGPVDNSDLVPVNGFQGPHLKFERTKADFIPIRPHLSRVDDYEILPAPAWKLIAEWYGVADNQTPIVRYATNTAPEGAASQNIQYEIYPPVFTIRKMLSASSNARRPPSPPVSNGNTGQTTPEGSLSSQAVRLLASQQDRWQAFLTRCKTAASIPMNHKVRPWRVLDVPVLENSTTAVAQPAMPTPAASRSNSASRAAAPPVVPPLVISKVDFDAMPEGEGIEMIDAKDETANGNYNGKSTIGTYGLTADQTLILEEQVRGPGGGEFTSDAKRKPAKVGESRANATPASNTSGVVTRGRARDGNYRARGKIGLANLGNTCYMNSALQCISRIEELAHYFLSSYWKGEVNTENPLGRNGRMARAYADFLSGLYNTNASSAFNPRNFKGALSQAEPMFSGYGQQDSQEFLSFLVDALHEDLNRVLKKPYRENPDSDDSKVHDPEYIKQLGEIYRENHRSRDDSIAMDLFNGFYKNTMVCPECDKISVTFDPYSLLTLQLPFSKPWQHEMTFVPAHGKPILYKVDMDKNASIKSLKQYLANKVGGDVKAANLLIADVFQSKFYGMWSDNQGVSDIGGSDKVFVYDMSAVPTNTGRKAKRQSQFRSVLSPRDDVESVPAMDSPLAGRMAVTVFFRRSGPGGGFSLGYEPFVILVSRDEAKNYDAIFRKLLAGVAKYTSRDFMSEAKFKDFDPACRRSSDSGMISASEAAAPADAKVSDHSLNAEDDYVNVSMKDGSSPAESADEAGSLAHPGSTIPTPLHTLFEVKYFASGNGDMQCVSTSNFDSATSMLDRVNPTINRRDSTVSIRSINSRSSAMSLNGRGSEGESSADEGEDRTSPPTADSATQSEEDRPDIMEPSTILAHKNHRGRGKYRPRGYGRAGRHMQKYGRGHGMKFEQVKQRVQQQPARTKPVQQQSNLEDDPYYIKLGEGIILDFAEEAWDALFGCNRADHSVDLRGFPTADEKLVAAANDPELEATLAKRQSRARKGVTLDECFDETAKTETLSEDNPWYCNRCKEHRQADKTLVIWTAPDILVVHLKRFSGERYRRDKIDVLVDFPVEGLDLSSRIGAKQEGKDYVYDLFAVDNHYGGLGGGHYTACGKNFFDGKWYDFNDSYVSSADGKGVVTTAAYLLFYRRRSATPLGPSYLRDIVEKARAPVDASDDSDNDLSTIPINRAGGQTLVANSSGAGQSLSQSSNTVTLGDDDEGISMDYDRAVSTPLKPIYGPPRPPHMLSGGGGGDSAPSWSFDTLDRDTRGSSRQREDSAELGNVDVDSNAPASPSSDRILDFDDEDSGLVGERRRSGMRFDDEWLENDDDNVSGHGDVRETTESRDIDGEEQGGGESELG